MNNEQLKKIIDKRLRHVLSLLESKGIEYANPDIVDDRLNAFKSLAAFDNTNVERSCWGMWLKHIGSIRDIVHLTEKGILPTEEKIAEKFTDNIVYSLLMEAILTEHIELEKPQNLV